MKSNRLPNLVRWLLILGITFLALQHFLMRQPLNVPISVIEQSIASGSVERLRFHPESLYVEAFIKPSDKNSKGGTLVQARAVSPQHLDEIRRRAEAKGIMYGTANPPNPFWASMFSMVLYISIFCGIWYFIAMRQGGKSGGRGMFNFGDSPAKRFQPGLRPKKTFADVAGCDEAKEELKEIVDFLQNPGDFMRLGSRIPKGVLLVGDPGTGKTLLAQAVAGEASVSFLSANGSEFVEMFVGVGASRIRSLFEEAKKIAPCIVFIDEIDAIGKKRGVAVGGGHDEREHALNQLLGELDGFVGNNKIVVIAATNRVDVLDEALIRPGRFDRQVYVPVPDVAGRKAILEVHVKNVKLAPAVDLEIVAKDTAGMVGADLQNVVNEATLFATRKKKSAVEQSDFSEAVDKVTMGAERKSMRLSEKEKKLTAYHEAGHALVALLTKDANPLHKITIIPRGQALGYTKQLPPDNHCTTKEELFARVKVAVGGRAAEELVFNTVTTGAYSDFLNATFVLRRMVYEFGMSENAGLVVHKEKTDFFGHPSGVDASQKTKELLEKEVNDKLNEIYKQVKKLLEEHRVKLDLLAALLLEKETVTADEVRKTLSLPAIQ
ncbi:MAG: hypothetical protein A3H63_00910 [Candidatus Harrisonbacteria bacterium RIFCSPLOWO2_02_FULL_45_10c]|uniref:ATP-dependent zinc metalloprotease FtsH n=1 Tax=Candidatus Harrisonbacteria bacterium RIFCSPLOWO2_02_FULL_45_10c TaxID=1798410 RepID=A0A1G1ZTA4_9BACT|nr:MAG: hypothetical protein A3H63_00910 [Candidatus Harrisonbacteria bacterium RIFCSPLOWO2_02_FULL_45_10c]